jgi:hypothetical protein
MVYTSTRSAVAAMEAHRADAGVVQSGIQLLKNVSMAKNNRVPGEWVGCRPNPCDCREKREREEL